MASCKRKLAEGDARLTAHICTITSATVKPAMVAAGADAVIMDLDLEHRAVDYGSANAMIAATARSDCAPLVRIAENEDWQVKRAPDLGAEGICFPLIRTVANESERSRRSAILPAGRAGSVRSLRIVSKARALWTIVGRWMRAASACC